jgi:FtsP/CotA-like multicopper oxidase with cupredoxin domain
MILPNAMDGVEYVTQAPVPRGGEFAYEFTPRQSGTRWYHDHFGEQQMRGLFGMFVVDDPRDEPADLDLALVFHDVPDLPSVESAMAGRSRAPMVDPLGSRELREMSADDKMGDEVAYLAHCINGNAYPNAPPISVAIGQRIRLRILNANPTQTRYVRLAGHRLLVTHGDGNPLPRPVMVDALRVGVGERYDAWFEVRRSGSWLLQGLSAEPTAFEQAVVFRTEGMETQSPQGVPESLDGLEVFDYAGAGDARAGWVPPFADVSMRFTLAGGAHGSAKWTIDGKTWPHTPKIYVHRGDRVLLEFKNETDMEHPLHLHGHDFAIVAVDGKRLRRPILKDTSLVRANGGTIAWSLDADSPSGRWLLHCHNQIHMMDGMMTELVYLD